MPAVSGGIDDGLGVDVEEDWVKRQVGSEGEAGIEEGTKNRRQNPTTTESLGEKAANAAYKESAIKRGWRAILSESPTDGGLKKTKFITGSDKLATANFLTVGDLKDTFQDANTTEMLGFYSFSVAFEPLRHLDDGTTIQCPNCKHAHRFGSFSFKPYFELGQQVFDLHCGECSTTTANEQMAEADVKLLQNLSEEDRTFLGLSVEAVSDSEEGTGLRITEPLRWLGNIENANTQERADGVASNRNEPRLRLSPSTEKAVLDELEGNVEMPDAHALMGLMKRFQAQLDRMEQQMRQQAQNSSNFAQRGALRRHSRREAGDSALSSEVELLRTERDELRR